MTLVPDLFDRLTKAKFFSKSDLRSGYWQVRIIGGDESKAACVTNAPAIFFTLMNNVFQVYIDRFVVVYLDDMVVYKNSLEEHLNHLRKVLSALKDNQLYVKPENVNLVVIKSCF